MSNAEPVWSQDQAAGLRNLFRPQGCVPVAFASGMPGLGCTRIVAQIAVALAARGETTLVLDEQGGDGNVAAHFGLGYRFDLAQAMSGDVALAKVLVPVTEQLNMASAVRAGRFMRQNACLPSQHMAAVLAQLRKDYRYLLVDASPGEGAHPLTTLGQWVGQMVLVVAEGTAALTSSFGVMKRFAAAVPHARLKLLVSRSRTEEEARAVFGRLQNVARQHLGLEVDYLGWVPFDIRWRESSSVEFPTQGAAARSCEEIAAGLAQWVTAEPATVAGSIKDLQQGVAA